MSLFNPNPPDKKKNEIVPVYESGRNYPEGDFKEKPIKYYSVVCPRCKAQVGFPCFKSRNAVDYRIICIARVIAFDTLELAGRGRE